MSCSTIVLHFLTLNLTLILILTLTLNLILNLTLTLTLILTRTLAQLIKAELQAAREHMTAMRLLLPKFGKRRAEGLSPNFQP